MGAVCAHCKLRNHMEDQCLKKAHRLQQQASPAMSATPASFSAPTTCNPTSTLLQQTQQPPARQSSPSSCFLNSMSSTLQQSSTPAPTAEQQDSIRGEEEYDEFFESQQALKNINLV